MQQQAEDFAVGENLQQGRGSQCGVMLGEQMLWGKDFLLADTPAGA